MDATKYLKTKLSFYLQNFLCESKVLALPKRKSGSCINSDEYSLSQELDCELTGQKMRRDYEL